MGRVKLVLINRPKYRPAVGTVRPQFSAKICVRPENRPNRPIALRKGKNCNEINAYSRYGFHSRTALCGGTLVPTHCRPSR